MKPAMLLLAVWAVALTLPAQAQNPGLERELQGVLEVFLQENSIAPGVAACAVCPDLNLDWAGAAGRVALDEPETLTPRHTFRIASNTKTYVAAAALRLVEMGRLELDQSLGYYLTPAVKALLENDGYDTGAITIAQVMSHTAGLADHTNDPRFEKIILQEHQHQWTSQEQLLKLVEWFDPLGDPGQEYVYSDSGYVILGTIIEKLTGRELGPAVRDLVDYEKLGLEVTYWEYLEEVPAASGPRAHQYYGQEDVTGWNASFDLYGGGGIITDVRELALFMRELMQGAVFEDDSTLSAMTGRGSPSYRLGLMVTFFDGRLVIGHQGFWNTFAFHVPSLDLTIGGTVLNHHATNGQELARRLVGAAADAAQK